MSGRRAAVQGLAVGLCVFLCASFGLAGVLVGYQIGLGEQAEAKPVSARASRDVYLPSLENYQQNCEFKLTCQDVVLESGVRYVCCK